MRRNSHRKVPDALDRPAGPKPVVFGGVQGMKVMQPGPGAPLNLGDLIVILAVVDQVCGGGPVDKLGHEERVSRRQVMGSNNP